VRLVAMNSTSDPTLRVKSAAPQLDPTKMTVSTQVCAGASTNAQVTVSYDFRWVTGVSGLSRFFGPSFTTPNTITAIGVMQCGG
jgi:hypothetical protein